MLRHSPVQRTAAKTKNPSTKVPIVPQLRNAAVGAAPATGGEGLELPSDPWSRADWCSYKNIIEMNYQERGCALGCHHQCQMAVPLSQCSLSISVLSVHGPGIDSSWASIQLWAAPSRVELHDSLSFLGLVTSPGMLRPRKSHSLVLPTLSYCTFPHCPPPSTRSPPW